MARDKVKFDNLPVLLTFNAASSFKETYGGGHDLVLLEGMHMRRPDASKDTVLVFMHPTATVNTLPMPREFARRGVPVLACGSRYPHNDTTLIMEKVLIDLGQYIRHAREVLGYRHVILAGWSGGASLSVYYQAQAERPTVTATPAGEPVDLAGLPRADGLLQLAAHVSRASIMTESMDASIRHELDPGDRDPTFDLYAPTGPKAPYPAEFVARYRAAQVARNRRITAWAREMLDTLARRAGPDRERCFVTHGTMADPRWLDPALDPNARVPGRCYLGDPATVNNGPVGLARFSTLRSWLSQWSLDDSNASTEKQGRQVTIPALVIANEADDACPPSHTDRIFDSLGGEKERHVIAGANHYYLGQREQLGQATQICIDWLLKRRLLDGLPEG
ncbi:MAG: alpha/beta hydrolase, partial [Gammaproteobacteria bacterium]